MSTFFRTLLGLHFSKFTPTMLLSQSPDKSRLQEKSCDGQCNLPSVTLPRCRLAKQNFTSWWQAALADVPPLKLSPIIFRGREADWIDAGGLLSSQHSDSNSSHRSGTLCG